MGLPPDSLSVDRWGTFFFALYLELDLRIDTGALELDLRMDTDALELDLRIDTGALELDLRMDAGASELDLRMDTGALGSVEFSSMLRWGVCGLSSPFLIEAVLLLRSGFIVSTFGLLVVDGLELTGLGDADIAYSLLDRLVEEVDGLFATALLSSVSRSALLGSGREIGGGSKAVLALVSVLGWEELNSVGIHIEYSLLMRLDGEALFPTAAAGTPELLSFLLLALNPRIGLAFMIRPSNDRLFCLTFGPSASSIWTKGVGESLPLLSLLLFTCTAADDELPPHHDGLCFKCLVVGLMTDFDCTSSAATGGGEVAMLAVFLKAPY
jgi:hypothetical protein